MPGVPFWRLFADSRRWRDGALQLATLTAKRQRSEATPLHHAVKARTR